MKSFWNLAGLVISLLLTPAALGARYGVTNDLWDVSQGVVVTAHSDINPYFDGRVADAENIFGTDNPKFDFESENVVFRDGKPAGFAHFVEWKTPAPVTIRSFKLHASGDGQIHNNQREFQEFKLYAKTPGSQTFDKLLYSFHPTRPYTFVDHDQLLVLAANIEGFTAQEFRAEFINRGDTFYSGPRIFELDGFSDYVRTRVGSTNDLWDVSRGAVVTAHSEINPYFDGRVADAENIFGTDNPIFDFEWGNVVFRDGRPAGYSHFIEWKTTTPVTIRGFKLHASGDGPTYNNQREFDEFRLYAKVPGSPTFDKLLYTFRPAHPYTFLNREQLLILAANIEVTAQEFRAEFINRGGTFYSGPRVFELDGFSQPVVRSQYGSTGDLWDVSRGTTVTAHSEINPYFDGRLADPHNIFGTDIPGFELEPGDVVFTDGKPAGFSHFVEWRTAAPVTIRAFRLHAQGDGPQFGNQREFAKFRLLARSPGSATFDRLLYAYQASHPYSFIKPDEFLLLEANVGPITAQEFRAEFVASSHTALNGPRILELDGFGDDLQLAVRLFPAVEITWQSVAERVYQVQWKEDSDQTWKNLKEPVVGKGGMESVFDDTRNNQMRLYRVVELSVPVLINPPEPR